MEQLKRKKELLGDETGEGREEKEIFKKSNRIARSPVGKEKEMDIK